MPKKKPTTATPKLRFPEFREGEAWMLRSIGPYLEECASRVSASTKLPIFTSSRAGLKPQDEYYGGQNRVNEGEYGVVPTGCIVYRHMSDDGVFVFNFNDTGGEIAVSKEYPVFRTHGMESYFLLQELNNSYRFRVFALAQKAGGTRTRLYLSKLRVWKTYVPSLPEQRRIADCLTSLDEVIDAQGRKVEALKTYKRGLMQQLFPQEGETVPRLRFPEFEGTGAWEERKLGPMTSKVGSGVTPRGGSKNYRESGRPFMRSQNVGWGHLQLEDIVFIQNATHQTFDGTEIREFDVLLNITGASIGRSAIADQRIVGGNVNQHVCIIRPKPETLFPSMLVYFLLSGRGQRQIDKFQAGGAREGLNFQQIRIFKIPVPPKQNEQRRIADCLSSLDAQIAAASAKLEALKTHKKGLLQQLFPTAEGV